MRPLLLKTPATRGCIHPLILIRVRPVTAHTGALPLQRRIIYLSTIPPPRQVSTLLKKDNRTKAIILFQSPQQDTTPPPSPGNLPKPIQVSIIPPPTTRYIMDIKILDMGISFHGQNILAALKDRGVLWTGIGMSGFVRVVYIFIKGNVS